MKLFPLIASLLIAVQVVALDTRHAASLRCAPAARIVNGCAPADRIVNDAFRRTVDGEPIYSQGGGVFRFGDRYYWYGVDYEEARTYLADPTETLERDHFRGVSCHSSTDFVNWRYEGDVLTPAEMSAHGRVGWVGRMGVAQLGDSLYVLVIQHNNRVLFATATEPTGQFRYSHEVDMTPLIGTPNTGDQTVFTDPDTGASYLIYSYGRGRNRQYISRIGVGDDGRPGLMDCVEVCHGESREGNCMFKLGGRYYMVASNIYGWDGSLTYYLEADSIYGPYTPANDMQVMEGSEADYSHVSQTGFFYTIRGTDEETAIYCGDRWAEFAGNGLGYNQWMPVTLRDGRPVLHSLSSWQLNDSTGRWRVADDNNWVLNGSFEADRRTVPLAVKPRQSELTGWTTEIITGTPVEIDNPASPQLNYFNTRDDRRAVTGEKSLNIADTCAFSRRVSQTIKSTPEVALPDGLYELQLTVRHDGGFSELRATVGTSGIDLTGAPAGEWTRLTLPGIPVSGGTVTVAIHALAPAAASAQIDDIEMRLK